MTEPFLKPREVLYWRGEPLSETQEKRFLEKRVCLQLNIPGGGPQKWKAFTRGIPLWVTTAWGSTKQECLDNLAAEVDETKRQLRESTIMCEMLDADYVAGRRIPKEPERGFWEILKDDA